MLMGIIILLVGVLYLAEALVPAFNFDFSMLWPTILIIISIYMAFKNKKIDLGSGLLAFIGLWFLLYNVDLIPVNLLSLFWPIVLIIVGLSIIFSTLKFKDSINKGFVTKDKEGVFTYHGIFGGVEEKVKEKNFKGAIVYSIFGGCEIDFSDIQIKNDSAEIIVYSIFGGSDLVMPTGFNIKFNSTAILGGNENKCAAEHKKGQKEINVNCISIFGGCEIK